MHCHPLSSTSLSCSWKPPASDYDAYLVECRRQGVKDAVYKYTLSTDALFQHFDKLEPFSNYTVSVTVVSGNKRGRSVLYSVVTMIDRKLKSGYFKSITKKLHANTIYQMHINYSISNTKINLHLYQNRLKCKSYHVLEITQR